MLRFNAMFWMTNDGDWLSGEVQSARFTHTRDTRDPSSRFGARMSFHPRISDWHAPTCACCWLSEDQMGQNVASTPNLSGVGKGHTRGGRVTDEYTGNFHGGSLGGPSNSWRHPP